MKRMCVAILCLIITGSAFADSKAVTKEDPRLGKKITIEVKHAKLDDVVKSISEQTGVDIKAGTGERDWRVREQHVSMRANDVPAGEVMDHISRLLGFYLSRSGKEGEWEYLYWQDMKSRLLEQEMMTAEKEAEAQRAIKMRQSALDTLTKALEITPDEAKKQTDRDPWLAYLASSKAGRGYAGLMSYLAKNFTTERDLMLRGLRTTMPLSNLPPDVEKMARDAMYGGIIAGFMPKEAMSQMPELQLSQIVVLPMSEIGGGSEATAAGFGGMVAMTCTIPGLDIPSMGMLDEFGGGIPMCIMPLSDSDSVVGRMFGQALIAMENGVSGMEAIQQAMGQMDSPEVLAEAMGRESPTEKDPPTDPVLTREVEIKDMPNDLTIDTGPGSAENEGGESIIVLSKCIGMPVLLESFISNMPLGGFIRGGKQPFYKVLVGIEKAGYTWQLENDTLRIRPEDWALQRSYQIQESFLEGYRKLLEKQGEFTLDDLAAMVVALTEGQIQNTLVADPKLSWAVVSLSSPFSGEHDMLRAYGTLNPQQKALMKTERGLPLGRLNAQQWDNLYAAIGDKVGGTEIRDGWIRLISMEDDIAAAAAQAQAKSLEGEAAGPEAMDAQEPDQETPVQDNSDTAGDTPGPDADQDPADLKIMVFKVSLVVPGQEKPRDVSVSVTLYGKKSVEELRKLAEKPDGKEQKGKTAPSPAPAPKPAK